MTSYTLAELRRAKANSWPKGQRFVPEQDWWTQHLALQLTLTTIGQTDEFFNECDCTGHLTVVTKSAGNTRPCPKKGHCSHVITLYGGTRQDGGYLIHRFICVGQKDTITADRFDDAAKKWFTSDSPLDVKGRIAIERLERVRFRLLTG